MTIAPFKSKRDYERTLHRIEALMDAKPGTKAGDELDVLTTLVEAYEAKRYAIGPPNSIGAIKFRMDQLGMTRKDLEALLGRRGRVSEILTKKRTLSLEMIRRRIAHCTSHRRVSSARSRSGAFKPQTMPLPTVHGGLPS